MRSIEWRSGLFAVAAAAAVGVYGCRAEERAPPPPPTVEEQPPAVTPAPPPAALPPGVTDEMVTAGQQVFTGTTCYTCHGPDANGTPLAPSLRSGAWLNIQRGDLSEIEALVRTGVPTPVEHAAPMPPMGGASLSDEQVRDVAAYVYSISRGKTPR